MKKAFNFQRMMALVICALTLCVFSSCVKEVTYGRIQGIITDASNNEPIQGVNVQLSPTGSSAVTGSDGRYEFYGLTTGQYTVQAMKSGYQSNTKSIEITAGNVASGDMTLKPEVAGFKLNVEYLDFGTNINSLPFKIISTTNSLPVSWSITNSHSWLSATPNTGTLQPGQETPITVVIDRSQIQQSTTANITVAGEEQTIVLPVNVTVPNSGGPQLQLSTNSLDFGTTANQLPFYVMNNGPVTTSLQWVCSPITVDWLMLTPSTGNTAGGSSTAVMATIDRTKFDGSVSTSVTISGAGATSTISISASSEGSGVAILQLSEGSIDFGDTDLTKQFQVKNVGSTGTVLDWSISIPTGVDWLSFSPLSHSTNAGSGTVVTAVVDRTKFTGVVSTTVTVNSSANSANLLVSAANVQSVLTVTPIALDFGKQATTKNLIIKNEGDPGSNMSWTVAQPSVSWLTVTPMSGTTVTTSNSTVKVEVDRTQFTGVRQTTIQITGGGSTKTIPVTVDNTVLVTDGLFCYFDFDDETQIVDWAENYTGINSGTTSSGDTPSGEGRSRAFNGDNAFIRVAGSIVAPGGPFTINLWYKTGGNNQYLIGSDATGDSYKECTLSITNNQNIRYEAGDKSGSWSELTWVSNSIASFIDNQWHMMTITFDGNLGEIYMDGVLFESKVTNKLAWGTGANTPVNNSFFGMNNNANYYNGKIDNYRSYNRALTAAEIQTLFDNKQ